MTTEISVTNNASMCHRAATDAAGLCRDLVVKTATKIQGRRYVQVEGWQAIANSFGCVASARDVRKVDGGIAATGQVVRVEDGKVLVEAEGFVGDDEKTWAGRPMYARRAMAQTRAISRACRSAFAFVVTMMDAGLETTPAEEVPHEAPVAVEVRPKPSKKNATAADMASSKRAINAARDLGKLADFSVLVAERYEEGFYTDDQANELRNLIDVAMAVLQEQPEEVA